MWEGSTSRQNGGILWNERHVKTVNEHINIFLPFLGLIWLEQEGCLIKLIIFPFIRAMGDMMTFLVIMIMHLLFTSTQNIFVCDIAITEIKCWFPLEIFLKCIVFIVGRSFLAFLVGCKFFCSSNWRGAGLNLRQWLWCSGCWEGRDIRGDSWGTVPQMQPVG